MVADDDGVEAAPVEGTAAFGPVAMEAVAEGAVAVVAAETAGVVRGGATGVSTGFGAGSARITGFSLTSKGRDTVFSASSAERGGASRSSSRAVGGTVPEGLIRPLALSDRLRIRGASVVAWEKLNSAGSTGSDLAAGVGFSGMTL